MALIAKPAPHTDLNNGVVTREDSLMQILKIRVTSFVNASSLGGWALIRGASSLAVSGVIVKEKAMHSN